MKKRTWLLLSLLAVAALALAACGGAAPAEEAMEEEAAPAEEAEAPAAEEEAAPEEEAMEEEMAEPLTFGVVLVGPRNDKGWSQAHFEAGQYIEQHIDGSQMIVFESLNPADNPDVTLEDVVDDMVSQGASLIFTTSDAFEEDTDRVAEKYPDVTFEMLSGDNAWADGNDAAKALPNVGNFMGQMVLMKQVAGCAAGMASQNGSVAYLGPLINDETRRLASAAYLGAKYCNETYAGGNPDDFEFVVTWIGFWFNIPGVTLDPTEVVNNFFDTGADVVMSGIDTPEGIRVTAQRAGEGEAVLAVPYDYVGACDDAPDVCLGVPFFNWGPAYLEAAQAVIDGTWAPSWDWNAPNWDNLTDPDSGGVGWISGPALTSDMQANLDEFMAGLASGDINLYVGPLNYQDGSTYLEDGEVATEQQIWYMPQLLEGMEGPSE